MFISFSQKLTNNTPIVKKKKKKLIWSQLLEVGLLIICKYDLNFV